MKESFTSELVEIGLNALIQDLKTQRYRNVYIKPKVKVKSYSICGDDENAIVTVVFYIKPTPEFTQQFQLNDFITNAYFTKKTSVKELLINKGCIVKSRDDNYFNVFTNTCGTFLVYGSCICGTNIDEYDDDMLYLNHHNSQFDIMEIYQVTKSYFFQSDFLTLRSALNLIKQGTDPEEVNIIYKREE